MKQNFDEKKATQVACVFLRLAGGTLNCMKLIKLMYLAERAALIRLGRPITWDSYFLLRHGPVLSTVLDLISEKPNPVDKSFWAKYVSVPKKYSVSLIKDCPSTQLAPVDESVITQVYEDYGSYGEWDLVELLHYILPEWKDPKRSAFQISYEDILRAGGKQNKEIEDIENKIYEAGLIDQMFEPPIGTEDEV